MFAPRTVLVALALAACRREAPRPRSAPPSPTAPLPTPATPPSPRRADVTVIERSPWTPLAPGARWSRVKLRLVPAPSEAHRDAAPQVLHWIVARLDVTRVDATVEPVGGSRRLAPFAARTRDAIVVTDSGFFEADGRPSGVVISRGVALHGPGPRGGSGVLAFTDARVAVLPVDTRDGGGFTPDGSLRTAVQCGPRVVERDGAPGIRGHDGRFAARTVACVRDRGQTLDLVATWDEADGLAGPELYDLATLLAGPSPTGDPAGCEAALNLDGGPSTGIFLRDLAGDRSLTYDRSPPGPTPWALVVRPRAPR